MSVSSVIEQAASTQPPPIPIQLDEYSASPDRCGVAVGTIQAAEMEWNVVFFSSAPCTYPAQLKDWFAETTAIVRADTDGELAPETPRRTTTRAQTARRTTRFLRQSACQGQRTTLTRSPSTKSSLVFTPIA